MAKRQHPHQKPESNRAAVHGRALTETIQVSSPDSVPPGYVVIPLPSRSIFAKAQVLSRRHLMPIFVEDSERRAYWVHESILPELVDWIRSRVFSEADVVDDV